MLAKLKSLFEDKQTQESEDPQEKLHMACAALLIEVAYADHNIEAAEKEKLVILLKQQFGLQQEVLESMVKQAEQEVKESLSMHQFVKLINENFSKDEKFNLVLAMWQIAYADGDLDRYEEAMIRKITDLIYVPHSKMMKAKHLAQT